MVDKRNFDFNNDANFQDLMRMLDEMQSRPRVEEVEEVLIQNNRPDPVRTNLYTPPVAGDGYDPIAVSDSLEDMLISPDIMQEMEQQQELERQSQALLQVEEEKEEELPARPADRRNPFKVLGEMIASAFPRRGDSIGVGLLKTGGLLGGLALLAAVAILLLQVVLLPMHNRQYNDKLEKWFNPDNTAVVTDSKYPEGMMSAFKRLYRTNKDVKGWLSFHSEGEEDFLDIEYPVVQTDDNTTYVTQDFHGRFNQNGTLFFDEKCRIENGDTNRSLILYGNSLGNGQMLSGLNRLVSNEAYAREAYRLTLSTLYEQSEYYVFAVVMRDKEETVPQRVLPLQNRFITTDSFFDYVQDLRDRSLFDYPTDIVDTDSILLLVTDMGKMNGVMDGTQVVVAARRVRPGEQPYDTAEIGPNGDVLMPYRWYSVQHKVIPDIYRGKDMGEDTTTTTMSTNNPFDSSSTVTDGSTTSSMVPTKMTEEPDWLPVYTMPSTTTTTATTTTTTPLSTNAESTTTTTTEEIVEDTDPSVTDPTESETEPEVGDPTEIEE